MAVCILSSSRQPLQTFILYKAVTASLFDCSTNHLYRFYQQPIPQYISIHLLHDSQTCEKIFIDGWTWMPAMV